MVRGLYRDQSPAMMLQMGTVAVDRRKLYDQVWSIPCARLAVHYGISDVGLAKVCRRYSIPRPPRGYWARVAADQRVQKTPLPRPHQGDEVVFLKGWDMTDEAVQSLVDSPRSPSGPKPEDDGTPHELVTLSRTQLLASEPDHDGLLSTGAGAVDVRVSSTVVDRSMSVLDALVKRWVARGGSFGSAEAPGGNASWCTFAMGLDCLGVRLTENVDEDKPLTDPGRLTSKLSLHIVDAGNQQFRRRWSDTKTQRLERLVGAFVDTLVNALAVIRQERLDQECIARQRERAKVVRKAVSRDASEVFYSRQDLMQNVRRWVDAQQVRAYLTDVQSAVEAGKCRVTDAEQFRKWFDWASQFADSIDPIVQGSLPEGSQGGHQNVATSELDLTAAARCAVDVLGLPDTDSLWQQSQDAVRNACEGRFGPVWNEITRVLDGLGYDVSKRAEASAWW